MKQLLLLITLILTIKSNSNAQNTFRSAIVTKWTITKGINWDADFQGDREFRSEQIMILEENKYLKKVLFLLNKKSPFKGKVGANVYKKFYLEIKEEKWIILTDGIYIQYGKAFKGSNRIVHLLNQIFDKQKIQN